MMSENLICLRELPGIRDVKEAWQNPRNHEYPASSYLAEKIDNASNALFCVREYDTYLDEDDPRDQDKYEDQYQACELPYEVARPFWVALGWDLSGDDGKELNCADRFKRQIIAASGALVKGARFHPQGDGLAAYDHDGEYVGGAEQFEERLSGEAERWLMQRKGRSI